MKQMLEISMSEMRFYAYHGVLPQEREVGESIVSHSYYI